MPRIMKRRRTTLSDQLRRAVDECPESRYRICRIIGMDQANMSRFMSGQTGLTLDTADRLAEFLGMELVERSREGRKGG